MRKTSKTSKVTSSWLRANAHKLSKLPHPSESPWSTENRDLNQAEINRWKAKGLIRKAGKEKVRCKWETPTDVWSKFEETVEKYDFDKEVLEREL